jgi:hypothetical protein
VADSFKARFEAGDADGRGAHVDTAARLAEVEGNADDANLLWGYAGEGCVGRWSFEFSGSSFVKSETQRLKARFILSFSARLKARPDTNHINYRMQKRKPRKILTAKCAMKSCKERKTIYYG